MRGKQPGTSKFDRPFDITKPWKNGKMYPIPSGKLKKLRKPWPIEIDGLPVKNGDFYSYVKLPEGKWWGLQQVADI